MPPGFGPEYTRSNDGGSHGLGGLRFSHREALRMEAIAPGVRGVYNGGHGPPSHDENYNGRPRMIVATGSIGMSASVGSAAAETWDMKAMAAHRHRTLVAECSAQRMDLKAQMQAIPSQTFLSGFRPPLMHSETLPPQACPPGFRHSSIYNKALPPQSFPPSFRGPSNFTEGLSTQSGPPGFGPQIPYAENSAIIQPEMKFRTAEPSTLGSEFHHDDRSGHLFGIRETMRGSSVYGGADRRGWFLNESSSGAGRVCENHFVDPHISKPYILPPQPWVEQLLNQSRGANTENESWSRDSLPQHVRPHSPTSVSKVTSPLALYTGICWSRNLQDDNLASTREAGKRRSYEGVDSNLRTPSFKLPRIDRLEDNLLEPTSRRAESHLEFEKTRSDGLEISDERFYNRDRSHSSPLHSRKQMKYRSIPEPDDRRMERWCDKQDSRTPHISPQNLSDRGLWSPHDGHRPHHSIDISLESKLRTRSSLSRPTTHIDRSSLRAPPRSYRSNSKTNKYRNGSHEVKRSELSNLSIGLPRINLHSRSPEEYPDCHRRALRADESCIRNGDRSPWLLGRKTSFAGGTDQHAASGISANMQSGVERKAAPDGSTMIHSSRAVGDHVEDERSRSGCQIPVFSTEEQSHCRYIGVMQKATDSLDIVRLSTDKIKNERGSPPPLRPSKRRKFAGLETKPEQHGNLDNKLPLYKNNVQFSGERASSSISKDATLIVGKHSVSMQPVAESSSEIIRNISNVKPVKVSQDLEVDWDIQPERITSRVQDAFGAAAEPSFVEISNTDDVGTVIPKDTPKEGEEHKKRISIVKSGQIQDEVQEGTMHPGKDSKSVSGSRSLLERKSLVPSEKNRQFLENGIIESGPVRASTYPSSLASEVTLHSPTVVLGTDDDLVTVSKLSTDFNEGTGQKVILTDHKTELIPIANLLKTPTGSDLKPSESLGKSHSPGESILQEDVLGFSCSQHMLQDLPTSKVSKERDSSEPSEIIFRTLESSSMATKFLLEESFVDGQIVQIDQLLHSGKEAAVMSRCNPCVGDTRVSSLTEVVDRQVVISGTSLSTLIPSGIETNGESPVNDRTAESFHQSVHSELHHSLGLPGHKQAKQPGGLVSEKLVSMPKLRNVMTEKGEACIVQEKQDITTAPQSSDLSNTSDKEEYQLARPGGNFRNEPQERFTEGDTDSTKLARAFTSEVAASVNESRADLKLIPQLSAENDKAVLHVERELGKRRKLVRVENGDNMQQVTTVVDTAANGKKTNTVAEEIKRGLISVKNQISSLKDGMMNTVPVLKPVNTHLASSHPPAQSIAAPQFPELRSYRSSKTWRREPTSVSSQRFPNDPRHAPAVVVQPSAYVRKKFSIVRFPTQQVSCQANVIAQPTTSYRCRQKDATDSGIPSAPSSKSSPCRPTCVEASSDLTTLACNPAIKPSGRASDETFGYVVSGKKLFMQRKLNRSAVGPSTASASPSSRPGMEKCDVPLGYVKRKTNQLVRCGHRHESSANDALFQEVGDQMKSTSRQRKYSAQTKTKTKLGRVLSQKNGRVHSVAKVWTLSNEGKHNTSVLGVCKNKRYPLFPWKRAKIVAPRLRRGRPPHEGKMGALFFHIRNQLQKYRSGHPVYTRSADGFSLHRSGVVSRSGANLKWTKSLMTQSILASEAATKVVAEAEKEKRVKKEAVAKARVERRSLQDSDNQAKLYSGSVEPSSVSSVESGGIGGAVYVRKGFGNQLVRDSRTTARVFASEKVRWSLHNARLRRAKKQAFCVYYTRFGVCKRGDGKCLYIHDPEKVAVCTKFLRGSCSDPACRLTHKVIPERMSDCSYFLEGLCTNENCPYRHVNVNPKAPICEGFLQGYCSDGDMCNKKHTYVCPQYAVTGKCSSSTCKLRHPKKKKQPTSTSKDNIGSKREGRYFAPTASAEGEYQRQHLCAVNDVGDKVTESGDERADFISIDELDSESPKESQDTDKLLYHRNVFLSSRLPKGGSTNALEDLLKPRFLLKPDVTSS